MKSTLLMLAGLLILAPPGWPQEAPSALERYRKLEFLPKEGNFAKGWQERVFLEYEIINTGDLDSLRRGLKDENPYVRSMAARALGILADKTSADALAELVKADSEYMVRIRAVESLGYLKAHSDTIERATKDASLGVCWAAKLAAAQAKDDFDDAAVVRQAYARGIKRASMGTAKVGEPAPDFTAFTTDGKPFKLSTVLGTKPIAIYFAAFDG